MRKPCARLRILRDATVLANGLALALGRYQFLHFTRRRDGGDGKTERKYGAHTLKI